MSNKNRFKEELSKTEFGSLIFTESDQEEVLRKAMGVQTKQTKSAKKLTALILTPLTAAALLLLVLMQTPVKEQIQAAFPALSSIFGESENEALKIAVKEELVEHINLKAEDKGIEMTVKEVLYDGARLTLGYTLKSEVPIGSVRLGNFYIDGEEYKGGSGQAEGLIDLDLPRNQADEFMLRMNVVGMVPEDWDSKAIIGKWDFEIPVKRKGTVYQLAANESATFKDLQLTVEEVVFAPTGTRLSLKQEQKGTKLSHLSYKLYDDKGNKITSAGAAASIDENGKDHAISRVNPMFASLKEIPEYLILKPYVRDYQYEFNGIDKVKTLHKKATDQLPITLPQPEGGIVIHKLEKTSEGKLRMEYEVKGDLPEIRGGEIMLNKGKEVTEESGVWPELTEEEYENFHENESRYRVVIYNTSLHDNLYFIWSDVHPKMLKDLEIKIPIDKEKLEKK